MRATAKNTDETLMLARDTKGLASVLNCGEATAIKIGTNAKARIQVGKRVLWNIAKVQEYLNSISEG